MEEDKVTDEYERDPLNFMIRTIYFHKKINTTFINIVKTLIALYLETFNVIGVVHIFKDETRTYLRQYISNIFYQQIGICSYFLQIYYTENITRLPEISQTYFLPLNVAGEKVYQELKHQCVLIKIFVPLTFVMLFCVQSLTLPIVSNTNENIDFTLMFIKNHIVVWPDLFLCIYYICIISCGYSVAAVCVTCIYSVINVKFQCTILAELLEQVSHGMEPDMENQLYQDTVYRRLKAFIEAHNKIIKGSSEFLEIGQWSTLVVSICVSLLYTGLAYFVLAKVDPSMNYCCLFIFFVSVTMSYAVIGNGQALQDESLKMYSAACNSKWEYWNMRNRKALLMIIINCSKEMKMTSFGLFHLGHELITSILKVTYSMVVLFVNVNKDLI